jgi:Mg2+-importing ATPase
MPPNPSFWNVPLSELLARHQARPEGLSAEEAAERLQHFGPNTLKLHSERPLFLQFLARFANPLVLVLLLASGISALTGEVAGFLIICVIVLLSVTLDFLQEHRASRAAEALRKSVAVHAQVWRGGKLTGVRQEELVPGDVVQLAAGDLVPADARLLDAQDLFVNQALLTGEPYPVEKRSAEPAESSEDLNAAGNAVFMGTSVVSGSARALVCRTGSASAVGAIGESLAQQAPPTSFELGTRRFGFMIMRLTLFLVLLVFLVNAVFHRPLLESLLFAIALAVGLTPELLPMIVSVTLARGALRMAGKLVIVKRLEAIHNLGSMDVLCTDKTGTLTEAHIRLQRHVDPGGTESEAVLELAYLNSSLETGLRSPLDDAILEHGAGLDIAAWQKIDEVPFDFERRRVSVLIDDGSRRLLVVKGAPEDVLSQCNSYGDHYGEAAALLTPELRDRIGALQDSYGQDGFRVLAIAWRQVPADHPHAQLGDETELVFAGFACFLDPPKPSAGHALRALASSGVGVKIVSGDNELVARHVCRELGLAVSGVLTGNEIQQLDQAALAVRVETVNLFCRVTPSQKHRVVLALKQRGHTVGFLGDGVNDAPPLHAADVGISVDSAVDVAKEAAELILLRQDLNVLHDGVLEGRRTFGNVMKYILMGTSSNFGNMLSMAGATLFLPFLPMLPMQILLNNLLYDLSEVPIPLDRVDSDYLKQPKPWDMEFIHRFMWTVGPVSSLFDFLTFFLLLRLFHADAALFHTGWFIESIATQVLVIFVIRTRGSPLSSRPNGWLVLTALAVVATAALLPFSPFAALLGFVPPPPSFFAALLATVLCYLAVTELVKRRFYRHLEREPAN